MEHYESDVVVIGAGVVGLAIARHLALGGREVFILEKNKQIGMETSARNSEVIHAGLYYLQDSLKARLCVEGRERLYAFCESHGVAHKRLGKLVVATDASQSTALAKVALAAAANGVHDLQPLNRAETLALEPALRAHESLFSPSTGIIDSHQYMLALLGDAEGAGALLVRDAEVTAVEQKSESWRLTVRNAGESFTLACRTLVNSAGLWAQGVARLIGALDSRFVPPTHLAKGSYVTLSVKSPFRHLVYPVPEHGGLGVHLTLDMGGAARFGPDVEWLAANDPAAIDYTVPADLPALFALRIADYWLGVTADKLAPGYSGVRPKTTGPKDAAADFRIDGPHTHGLPGLVNLFGIESPGLTSSLAIADYVGSLLA